MRKFYRLNGSSVSVSEQEYKRRKARQAARIDKRGLEVWTDRRGRQSAVTLPRLVALENKRKDARAAAQVGWDALRESKKEPVRIYAGPSAVIKSQAGLKGFRERLYHFSSETVSTDGRMGRLRVSVTIRSDVHGPGGLIETVTQTEDILLVSNQKILGKDRRAFNFSMAPLIEGVKGLKPDSPKKKDAASEVDEDGRIGEADEDALANQGGEDSTDGKRADRGYYAELTSEIVISQI